MRLCTKCKLPGEFYRDKSKKDGVHSVCKKCHKANRQALEARDPGVHARRREKSRLWRLSNPDRAQQGVRSATLRALYGVSLEEYEAMLALQNNGCGICGGVNANGRRLSVDHHHSSGKVRGLLCSNCNRGLGLLGDDKESLLRALNYLNEGE